MTSLISALTLLTVLVLGTINIILLAKSLKRMNSVIRRAIFGTLCALTVIMCYFLGRAGFVSDEQMISGSEVAPFYGTEWYVLIVIGVAALLYQLYIIRTSTKA